MASMPTMTVRQIVAAAERIRFVNIGIRTLLSLSILKTPVIFENGRMVSVKKSRPLSGFFTKRALIAMKWIYSFLHLPDSN
jgi:hypothetical protein